MPADRPYTDAELEAGARALARYDWDHNLTANREIGPHHRPETEVVLDAVLPGHDARVRAEVVEEIAHGFATMCRCTTPDPPCTAEMLAAHIRGTYATIGGDRRV